MYTNANLIELTTVQNQKLAKRYNAILTYFKAGEHINVDAGVVNYGLSSIEYITTGEEHIEIKWGDFTSTITDPRELTIDRKFRMLELHR